jgi:hypothetical protein
MQSAPTHIDLMNVHVHTSYTHDANLRIDAINDWVDGRAPRFWLGRTSQGVIWRFRADLPDDLCSELTRLCRAETYPSPLTPLPLHDKAYRALLHAHAPIKSVVAGLTYWFPRRIHVERPVVRVTTDQMDLLHGALDAWIPDVPHQQPFVAALENGKAVSVCASVRISAHAHVAGVETASAYRRRGHATSAVAGWSNDVMDLGCIALYSTSWENSASQGVAAKLGLEMFGVEYHIA